jgi:hypothetical protein
MIKDTRCSKWMVNHVRRNGIVPGIMWENHYSQKTNTSVTSYKISEKLKKIILGAKYEPLFANLRCISIKAIKHPSNFKPTHLKDFQTTDPPDVKQSDVEEHLVEWNPDDID